MNDWDCAFRDKLRACGPDGTTVACSSSGITREFMSNESCLLDLLAEHKRGILGAVGHCEEFDPVLVHRAKMDEKDFIDKMGVYDVVPRSAAAKIGCRVIRTRRVTVNKGFDDFLDTSILVHTSHCGSRCRTTCLHKTCSSTCHHMFQRLLFLCSVFFLCLSCFFSLSLSLLPVLCPEL